MKTVPLLEVRDVRVYFGRKNRSVCAVDGVSFTVEQGESLGLVGESGCGKSTLGRAILGLEKLRSGVILFEGSPTASLSGHALRSFRERAQMIFQDPYGSLNPRMSIGHALNEVLRVHRQGSRSERKTRVETLFRDVGLDPGYLSRYPHEFSGGQRQRIGIARALSLRPSFVIADEPVSALDVSVQVQILNLLKDLQTKMNLAYLFVAHDLAVVRYVCTKILVMYLGRIVESASADGLYRCPLHPYTEALLSAVPDIEKGLRGRQAKQPRIILKGDVQGTGRDISGCPFHPRCHRAQARCRLETPALREVESGRLSACHFAEELMK